LSQVESAKAMTIALVTPLVAVVIGGIFLGESLLPQTFFGGALILGSVGLVVFRKIEMQSKEICLQTVDECSAEA